MAIDKANECHFSGVDKGPSRSFLCYIHQHRKNMCVGEQRNPNLIKAPAPSTYYFRPLLGTALCALMSKTKILSLKWIPEN